MKYTRTELLKTIKADSKVKAKWETLTEVARIDFINWVESAKQEETRKHRITRAKEMLMAGKRRPCCYAVVPLALYSQLFKNPKAQSHWKTLTPIEKRLFTVWIDSAKNPSAQKERIKDAIESLLKGKRKP